MTLPSRCFLRFPHHQGPLTPQQMMDNYETMERWVAFISSNRDCMCADCGEASPDDEMTIAIEDNDACLLHVPFKAWTERDGWAKDQQNLAAIERWAVYFILNCGCGRVFVVQPQ